MGWGTWVERGSQGSTKEYCGENILSTTLPLSNVIPFFFTHITRNLKWLSHRNLGGADQVSSFNEVCKKVDRSAKYCGASQKDYRCAKYQGAVQNIGAVPGNQKQDSIN